MNTNLGTATRRSLRALGLLALAAIATDSSAKSQPLTDPSGARISLARSVASNGPVQLPTVTLPDGREASFVMESNGRARLVNVHGSR